MASALDAVLGLIAQEKQQEQFKSQQITDAVNIFQRAREMSQQGQLEKLRMAQQQKQFDVSSNQDAQRIDIAKEGNVLQKQGQDIATRGQNIDMSRFGLKDTAGVISENPDSNYQKNILAEIEGKKSQELISNVIKGQGMISSGAAIQKAAYDAEDDALYAEGQQAIDMGRNIIKATVTPPNQTVAGHLDPQTAAITPFVPTTPGVAKPEQTKTISQIKAEREKKKQEQEIEQKKQEVKISEDSEQQKKINEDRRKSIKVIKYLNRIGDEFKKTSPYEPNPAQAILGGVDILKSGLRATDAQRKDIVYRDWVKSLRSNLARGKGEVGNLSQGEQEAVMGAVPSLMDDRETASNKVIASIKDFALQAGGEVKIDKDKNMAIIFPDGTIEEVGKYAF